MRPPTVAGGVVLRANMSQSAPLRHRRGLAEKVAHGFVQAIAQALEAEAVGDAQGFLQGLDPRVKLVGLLSLIVSVVLAKSLAVVGALFLFALVLAFVSRITAARLAAQAWISVLFFTGVIALPSIFVVPGTTLLQIPLVHWSVTEQGLRSAAFLVGRAETSATFALLLVLTTPWTHLLKAMRAIGVPVAMVAILGMTHRYIFALLHTATQMFEARRARIVAPMNRQQQRRLLAATAGVLLGKAFDLASEVHLAMVSRGYRGEVHLLDRFHARSRDWAAGFLALTVPFLVLWGQR